MIRITDPRGPDAARSIVNGVFAVAEINNYAADIVLSANCSVLVVLARELPDSREAIANALRRVLQIVESGQFPVADQAIGIQPASNQQLH